MPPIRLEHHAGWHKIVLNRPARLNAFNAEMHAALRLALDAAADDEGCRAVLLTGEGRAFCAGQDLTDLGSGDPNLGGALV